ncbi:DsbA family protein [Pararhizobium mangrovi]|nr:DsbA family protein [Pararhizobium mangrovi]
MKRIRRLAALTLAALTLAGNALASDSSGFDPSNKEQLGQFVHDYLVQHPEVLLDAQDALQAKQQQAAQKKVAKVIADNRQALYYAPGDLVLGDPDGSVTLVEFYDYNCPYCRAAVSDMKTIVANEKGLRYVLKEFPILGDDSMAASRASMAFEMLAPNKFKTFHDRLMAIKGSADAERAEKIAADLGVDPKQLEAKMKDPKIGARIRQTYALADKLNLTGTPAYVVGDMAVSGVIGADALRKAIGNVRACGSTTCS